MVSGRPGVGPLLDFRISTHEQYTLKNSIVALELTIYLSHSSCLKFSYTQPLHVRALQELRTPDHVAGNETRDCVSCLLIHVM